MNRLKILTGLAALTLALAFLTPTVHSDDCGLDVRPEDMPNGDYGGFVTWSELAGTIKGWVKDHPDIISCQSLGKTYEGRDIPLLKISDNPGKDEDEPEVLFLVGVHPREQAPTVSIVRFVDEILSQYGKDPEITKLVNEREIWIVPMLNVDGKIYDMKHGNGTDKGADWRKNRHKNADGTFGVDLNRNFPVRWGSDRTYDPAWKSSTADTRGNIYEGPSPASEPEVQALMQFIKSRPLRAMLDLHSPLHDLRAPGSLSVSEAAVYEKLMDHMLATEKEPYPHHMGKGGKEPDGENRPRSNTGVSFPWSYYCTGAYSFNLEFGLLHQRYPKPADIEKEYTDNIRGPLFSLLKDCGDLKLASPGQAKLMNATVAGEPKAGAEFSWKPNISMGYDYAVLTSESPSAVITGEFRFSPITKGFTVAVQKDVPAGTKLPLALYVWDSQRRLSVIKDIVTTK